LASVNRLFAARYVDECVRYGNGIISGREDERHSPRRQNFSDWKYAFIPEINIEHCRVKLGTCRFHEFQCFTYGSCRPDNLNAEIGECFCQIGRD
jgi:hypothetical protein